MPETPTEAQKFFQLLIPEGDIIVTDINGREYRLPKSLPARRQIIGSRLLTELLALPVMTRLYNEVLSMEKVKMDTVTGGVMFSIIARYASEEELVNKLAEIFKAVYPTACQDGDPVDLFSIEELVKAIVPFAARPIMGLLGMVDNLK